MRKSLFRFAMLFLFLACGASPNSGSFKGTGSVPCYNNTSDCHVSKPNAALLKYSLTCNAKIPTANVLTGTGTFKLENNTFVTMDLFLLENDEYELSYLEHDGSFIGKNEYLTADKKVTTWNLSTDNNIILSDVATTTDKKTIAQGSIVQVGQQMSLNLKFNRDLSAPGLAGQTIKLNLSAKSYGRGMKSTEDLCKLN